MRIKINRQACCSQDDQVGPLEAKHYINVEDSFFHLIEQIVKSGFLQFSSTHDRLTGVVNGVEIVDVFSDFTAQAKQPIFHVDPKLAAIQVLDDHDLSFYFRHI